jgi:hypothetical protein
MAIQIEDLYFTLPYGLAAKDFMDRYSLNVNRSAVMQLRNCHLNPCDVIFFILHSVEPIRQPSMRCFPLLRPALASCGLPWRERLVPVHNENTGGGTGLCLEIHDLAVSKLVAGREKDIDFLNGLLRHRLVRLPVLPRTTGPNSLAG